MRDRELVGSVRLLPVRLGGVATRDEEVNWQRVPVTILQVRHNFGRTDVLVSPVGGSGEAWVDSARLEEADDE